MTEATTYITLQASRKTKYDLLVDGIISELAGGFTANARLKFVFVGTPGSSVLASIEDYRNAFDALNSRSKILFRQKVDETEILNGDDTDNNFLSSYDKIYGIASQLRQLDLTKVSQDDTIVVATNTEEPSSFAIYNYLRSKLQDKNIKIRQVCMCSSNTPSDIIGFLLDNYTNTEDTIITGLRDDNYNEGITLMQTVEAILGNGNTPVGIVDANTDGLYYTQNSLGLKDSAAALSRLGMLQHFRKSLNNPQGQLKKWADKMEVNAARLWKEGNSFPALLKIIDLSETFIDEMNDFSIDLKQDIKDEFEKSLTSSKKKINGLTEQEKRAVRLENLLEAIERELDVEISGSEKSYPYSKKYVFPDSLFYTEANYDSPSPTFLWEITDYAFMPKVMNSVYAKSIRSQCLDLWEVFFRHSRKEIEGELGIEVDEYLISKLPVGSVKTFFLQTNVGKQLDDGKIIFAVKRHGDDTPIAYSSPLTGFAVDIRQGESARIMELNERKQDFIEFIYNYARCIGGFSENFTEYIDSQTDDETKHIAESRGHNIIAIYPQFRKHVGLDYTDKQ